MKIEPYKIEPNRWYSISQLEKLKMLPVHNNRENISKLIKDDLNGANIMKAEILEWSDGKRSTYRVKGEYYSNYIALKGWLKE